MMDKNDEQKQWTSIRTKSDGNVYHKRIIEKKDGQEWWAKVMNKQWQRWTRMTDKNNNENNKKELWVIIRTRIMDKNDRQKMKTRRMEDK